MTDVDVVVIGSGAGGMAAAVALANAGKKVVVFEQHYLPGGWCHSFSLGGYRFSPGVHYIGGIAPGGRMRNIYEGLGLSGDLEFCEINPDGFDHIVVGRERLDIPKGREAFRERLTHRFPREAKGIAGYLETVDNLARELNELFHINSLKDALKLPLKSPTVTRWAMRSARALIHHHAEDPLLRAFLAGQCGDHGLPPSMASAAVHAAVVAHYFDGGFYPRGGAASLPRAYIRQLRRKGGSIKVKTGVTKILVEDGRAIGVRLQDGTEVRARHIISNADPHVTLGKLVGEEHLSLTTRLRLKRTKYSVSALSLFMAADMDVRRAGLDSGNSWLYDHDDIEGIYMKGFEDWTSQPNIPGMFLTVTSLKDPSKWDGRAHTMEAFAFVPSGAFNKWAQSAQGERPGDYSEMKDRLTRSMLKTLDRHVPGLSEHVVFKELGTPLTNVHYVNSTEGNLYGTEKSRFQIGPFGWQIKTELGGLWMCGASTLGHGVEGATLSGLAVARGILRCRMHEMLNMRGPAMKIVQSEHPEQWLPSPGSRDDHADDSAEALGAN